MKLVCAIFMLYENDFFYFIQTSDEGKSGNDLEPPIKFYIEQTKQTKREIFHSFTHSFIYITLVRKFICRML